VDRKPKREDKTMEMRRMHGENKSTENEIRMPEIVAIAFYVAIALFSLYFSSRVINAEPSLACGVAEISPDFSAEDRKKCRQIRGHKL
jgi:hypothetical protein